MEIPFWTSKGSHLGFGWTGHRKVLPKNPQDSQEGSEGRSNWEGPAMGSTLTICQQDVYKVLKFILISYV